MTDRPGRGARPATRGPGRPRAAAARRRWRRRRRPDRPGPAARQAAVRTITAIDLNKGDQVWQIAHGETPDNIKNNPALKGLTIPRTGRQGRIGVLTTKTLRHRRRRRLRHDARTAARRDAARVRQGDGQGRRRRLHAGAADRVADDLHAERQAVHHRVDCRSRRPRRADRLPAGQLERISEVCGDGRILLGVRPFLPSRDRSRPSDSTADEFQRSRIEIRNPNLQFSASFHIPVSSRRRTVRAGR